MFLGRDATVGPSALAACGTDNSSSDLHESAEFVLCWTGLALTLIACTYPRCCTVRPFCDLAHARASHVFLAPGSVWCCYSALAQRLNWPRWRCSCTSFLATLRATSLSGFLVFSDRVAYPVYFSTRAVRLSVLEDQQCAAA